MSFIKFDFGDFVDSSRELQWINQSDGTWLDTESHTFQTFGTYQPQIVLTNNVSLLGLHLSLEVEQCVTGFRVNYTSPEYEFFTTHPTYFPVSVYNQFFQSMEEYIQ